MNQINRMLYRIGNLSDTKVSIGNLTLYKYNVLHNSFYYDDLSTLVAQTQIGHYG